MEAKTVAIVVAILAAVAGSIVAVGLIPVSASSGGSGGGTTIVCTADLTVSGTYNDYVVSHSISNFAFTAGGIGCHQKTLLDLIPSSQLNLFPTSLTFSVTLTAADGTTHGPYLIKVSIPAGAAAPSFSFAGEAQVSSVPQGQYTAFISCPVACNGQTSFSTSVNI